MAPEPAIVLIETGNGLALVGGQEPPARLGALFTATDTSFDQIRSPVTLADSQLNATDVHLAAQGYVVTGRGSPIVNTLIGQISAAGPYVVGTNPAGVQITPPASSPIR